MTGNTDRNDPSTWNTDHSLIDGLIDDLECGGKFAGTGAWLVRQRESDGAYIVYKAVEVRER